MDLASIRLVVLDIDGTIRTRDDPDCREVERALTSLDEAGIPWTFATGRPYGSMVEVTKGLFRDGRRRRRTASNYNGFLIHGPNEAPRMTGAYLGATVIAETLALASKERMGAVVFSCRDVDGRLEESVRLGGWRPDTIRSGDFAAGVPESHDSALGHDQFVVSVTMQSCRDVDVVSVARMQERLGEGCLVSTAGGAYFDIMPVGVTKGASLGIMAAAYGVSVGEVMAIGDGLNDLEMLSLAGVGVAVANAPETVKAVVDVVTDGRSAAGVAEAVMALLRERERAAG